MAKTVKTEHGSVIMSRGKYEHKQLVRVNSDSIVFSGTISDLDNDFKTDFYSKYSGDGYSHCIIIEKDGININKSGSN